MATSSTHEITQLLLAWRQGDEAAFDRLIPLVHRELHYLAKRYMKRERAGHMLQTTALVNEAYLHLVDCGNVQWQNRAHFFAVAARSPKVHFFFHDCQPQGHEDLCLFDY